MQTHWYLNSLSDIFLFKTISPINRAIGDCAFDGVPTNDANLLLKIVKNLRRCKKLQHLSTEIFSNKCFRSEEESVGSLLHCPWGEGFLQISKCTPVTVTSFHVPSYSDMEKRYFAVICSSLNMLCHLHIFLNSHLQKTVAMGHFCCV